MEEAGGYGRKASPSTLLWCWALAAKRSTSSFFNSYAFGIVKARMMTARPEATEP